MNIKVEYDGEYPVLCFGTLIITIDGKVWNFGSNVLHSGGSWYCDDDDEGTIKGDWIVSTWPVDFPKEYKEETLNAINEQIEHGCCGGCI